MQRRHITIGFRQSDVRLSLRPIAVLSLQPCRQGSLIHLAKGRQVVVAHPSPQSQLLVCDDGRGIHDLQECFDGILLWLHIVNPIDQSHIGLATA